MAPGETPARLTSDLCIPCAHVCTPVYTHTLPTLWRLITGSSNGLRHLFLAVSHPCPEAPPSPQPPLLLHHRNCPSFPSAVPNLSDSETAQAAFERRRSVWEGALNKKENRLSQGEAGRNKCRSGPEDAEEGGCGETGK